jgi:hypothetical protein
MEAKSAAKVSWNEVSSHKSVVVRIGNSPGYRAGIKLLSVVRWEKLILQQSRRSPLVDFRRTRLALNAILPFPVLWR